MNIGPVPPSPLTTIHRAMAAVTERAAELASASHLRGNASTSDTVRAVTDLHSARQQVQAAAKVIEVTGDVLGTLLDVKA